MVADRPLLFPDVESLVVGFLHGFAGLDGVAVGVELPEGFDDTTRAVVVTRVGGAFNDDSRLDTARIRLDCYGPGKTVAHALACLVRGAMSLLPRSAHTGGVVVSDMTEEQGPYWFTDDDHPGAHRYLMRFRVAVGVGPAPA